MRAVRLWIKESGQFWWQTGNPCGVGYKSGVGIGECGIKVWENAQTGYRSEQERESDIIKEVKCCFETAIPNALRVL